MKADDDKIREQLTLVRGRDVPLDPCWTEIDAIVPTEALVKMISGKPCKQCVAEERAEIKQAFFFAPVSVTGKQDRYFGLVGLCGEHVLLFIRGLDARGRTGNRGVSIALDEPRCR